MDRHNPHFANGIDGNGPGFPSLTRHPAGQNVFSNGVANGHVNGHANSHENGYANGYAKVDSTESIGSLSVGYEGQREPIAICGMALRLPGGVHDTKDFWEVLYHGKDTRGPIPKDRYHSEGFSDKLGKKGAIKTQYGYFIDDDISCLDPSFFTMSKRELEKTDPQQRQILEVTRECLESAGEVNYRGKNIGCYVGTFGEDWLYSISKESQHEGGYNLSGDLMIANRVSFEYDFRGPSMVIKTGCSASLVGLHEACRALQLRDCTAAIVAGTNLIMGPTTTAAMTQEGILSPEGSCKTFDASADGFARGEAINAVYIKRLDDAIRDGNPIRAVIRNTATNSDGRGPGLMAPNGKAHEAMMRAIYIDAKLDPRNSGFVECHGTGTPTGDPIETTAVGNVFGEAGVYIGSVKPNVGHAEGASGITSLIKCVLALEHQTIPPNIKFNSPNPKIDFDQHKLKVPITPTSWPTDRAQRISINSFGIGGSNAHVILDSAKEAGIASRHSSHTSEDTTELLVFSANTQDSLQRLVDASRIYLEEHPDRLSDIAYTLSLRRETLAHRSFSIAKNGSLGETSPFTKVTMGNTPSIVMIFSGQGAQWAGMGRDLIETDPLFRTDIAAMDDTLRRLKHPPNWTLEHELLKSAKITQLDKAEIAQPLCTAVQIALYNSVSRCGIHAQAVIGHSSGEIAAAYGSGALSMAEAIIVAYYRGYVTKEQRLVGGMAAVGLDATSTATFLRDGVVVACENSPNSTTISGDLDELDKVIERIKEQHPDTLARKLKVDMAYHSHHMKSLSVRYRQLVQSEIEAQKITRHQPQIPIFSSVIDDVIDSSAMLGPDYWVWNLTSPVKFQGAVKNLLRRQSNNIFLEIGPHSTLAGPLRQICADARATCLYVPTMIRSAPCVHSLLSAFGQLFQQGVSVDFSQLYPSGKVLTDLPTYPWDHSASYWYESRVSKDWRFRQFGHHAVLGQRVLESTNLDPSWRVVLDLEDEPWLYDHKVRDDVVFPLAGYISMAGEAVRQLSGNESGYSVRHVVAHTALVLTESKSSEVVTTLRRHKLTDSTDSDGYDFVISSFAGSTWIKNCEGIVRPNEKPIRSVGGRPDVTKGLPRKLQTSRWYDVMARVGLNYGPEFQGMENISASPIENRATCEIKVPETLQGAPFPFHPATIDACFQLAIAAMAKGAGRDFTQLSVPTMIEELDVSNAEPSMQAEAWMTAEGKDVGIEVFAGDRVALRLRDIRMNPLDNDESLTVDRHAAAHLEWCPDFDFMDIPPLFTPPVASKETKILVEELTLLCILDSAERLRGLETEQPHFLKFRDWLQREISRAQEGTYPMIQDAKTYLELSHEQRHQKMQDTYQKLATTPSTGLVATGIMRICEKAEDLFTGKADTLDLLMTDNILTEIYNSVSFGHSDYVRMMSNTKPNLRILEVGAGTGGTTELILRDLVSSGGNPAYSLYTFTDISAGFFPQAKERFAYAPNMEYKTFDISQDFTEQGFEAGTYDLILAPNVVHATPSLQETLRNLRPLLRPHGHLVLSEVSTIFRAPGYVFGHFSGWWLGEADNRKYEPYVSVDRWDRELKEAGYTGADISVYDAEPPYSYCAAIVARSLPKAQPANHQSIVVLCDKPNEGISQRVIHELQHAGYAVQIVKYGETIPPRKDVIATLDLERYFFESISKEHFVAFQQMLRDHDKQNILWLMPPVQMNCSDPRPAQTLGAIRIVRAELAVPLVTLEIDVKEPKFINLVSQVFEKVRVREDIENLLPDREFAVENGVINIGRYQPYSLKQTVCDRSATKSGHAKTLEILKPGLLETLKWVEGPVPSTLGSDQVEVETRAVGMNFRDIVVSMGVLTFGSSKSPLGVELAGVVRRVGSQVTNVRAGDRVVAVAYDGCFTTNAIMLSPLVCKIPDHLSFEEAATMPGCFATSVEALFDVGGLEKGQTVLIHSAAGGVGHAAIELCRMVGAEIYVTCGNDEKRQYLSNTLKIPTDRIFNSRDDSFLPDIMRVTNGRGVDIVLNSLSGELLHASWRCVAPFGKLVELGKRDLAGFGKLDLSVFLANRSYCCVDIAHSMQERPVKVGKLLERCIKLYIDGHIHPINPMALFDAADIEQAFRYLQKGDHIGKAVVQIPVDVTSIPSIPQSEGIKFDHDASYLLTGGLGGLGKELATWMAERGARNFVFLSRSAGLSDQDKIFFKELDTLGCSATPVAGKAEDMDAVKRAISAAPKRIKGVVHLAMVLRDNPILEMAYDEWTAAIAPKVDGAWNLHNAFKGHELDFFVMTSSLVTIVDEPGQANYCAANTFLESFCQYRHGLGLPASVLSICPVDGVGFVADNPTVRKKLKSQGLYFLSEGELLDFVELAILSSRPLDEKELQKIGQGWRSTSHLIMGLRSEVHLDDPKCLTSWRRDRRMGMYHNVKANNEGDDAANSNALKAFLAQATDDPEVLTDKASADYLAHEIGIKIFNFLLKPEEDVNIGLSLTQIGLDSLMAIELRRWWKQAFGLDISVLEIMASGTLEGLGKVAAEGLHQRLTEE